MTASLLGTMGWCESTGGRLSETERIVFARNVASLRRRRRLTTFAID